MSAGAVLTSLAAAAEAAAEMLLPAARWGSPSASTSSWCNAPGRALVEGGRGHLRGGGPEAWYREAIRWTAAAGGLATGGHVGAFSVRDWLDPEARRERWTGLQAALGRLAADGRRAGLDHLLVENLAAAREPSTMAMVRDLVDEGDSDRIPVRLCLDVGHMVVPGTSGGDRDPYAWLRALGAVATVVQLQQSDTEGDHHWPFTAARNAEGRVDADRVIDALGEGGVGECALILEVIPAFEQPDGEVIEDLVASVEYWREALDRRGVLASA